MRCNQWIKTLLIWNFIDYWVSFWWKIQFSNIGFEDIRSFNSSTPVITTQSNLFLLWVGYMDPTPYLI